MKIAIALSAAAFAAAPVVVAAAPLANTPVLPGDLMVYEAGPGTGTGGVPASTATNVNILELNSLTSVGNPIQTFAISSDPTSPLFIGGSASSNGLLSLSNDRSQLDFTGYTSAAAATIVQNTVLGRGVGTINALGVYSLGTSYTGVSGNQARGATTIDGTHYAIGDQGGIYTNGATTPSPTGNIRGVKSFGGTLYALQASSSLPVVSTLSAVSGGSLTGLTGIPNVSTAADFYLASSGANGSAFDTMFVTTTSALTKYALLSGTWTSEGSAAISGGLYGVAVKTDTLGGFDIYATTGDGGSAGKSVVSYRDTAAYNSAITLGAATTLFTAPANGSTLKGIDFAPVAAPEPASIGLIGIGGLLLARRRRI